MREGDHCSDSIHQKEDRGETVVTPVVYFCICLLAIIVALVSEGFMVVLAFVVGGIAFFLFQLYFFQYYLKMTEDNNQDRDSEDDER